MIGATTVRDGWALLSGSRGPITLTAMYSQCPSCKARFRVTAATLRAAHGRGRCGHCGHSFDVLAHLSDELPDGAGIRTASGNVTRAGRRAPDSDRPAR